MVATLALSTDMKKHLAPKVVKFLESTNGSTNQDAKVPPASLIDIFPCEGVTPQTKEVTETITTVVPASTTETTTDADDASSEAAAPTTTTTTITKTIVVIPSPSDIPSALAQFWISDLQYAHVQTRLSEFHTAVQSNPELLPQLVSFAKVLFERNFFLHSYFYLKLYIMNSNKGDLAGYNALWGLLTTHVLLFTDAKQRGLPVLESDGTPLIAYELESLRHKLESTTLVSKWTLMQHRLWMIHYTLLIFRWDSHFATTHRPHGSTVVHNVYSICFGTHWDRAREKQEGVSLLPIVQSNAPYLVPYIIVSAIINYNSGIVKGKLMSIVKLLECISSEGEPHPVESFLQSLFIQYDWDAALKALEASAPILKQDFLIKEHADVFLSNAKDLVATSYANVHSTIQLSLLKEKFGYTSEQLENLFSGNTITDTLLMMRRYPHSIYNMVFQKGEDLSYKRQQKNEKYDRSNRKYDRYDNDVDSFAY